MKSKVLIPEKIKIEPLQRLTVNKIEASKMLGVSEPTLAAMMQEGLPHFRRGGKIFFSIAALKEWAYTKATESEVQQ